MWPAKQNTGYPDPRTAHKLDTAPYRRCSDANPVRAKRSANSAWHPASSGVIECREISSQARFNTRESLKDRIHQVDMSIFISLNDAFPALASIPSFFSGSSGFAGVTVSAGAVAVILLAVA